MESVWCAQLLMILLVDVTILDHSIACKSLCTSTGYQWTISMISFHKSSMLQLGPKGPLPCRQVLLPQWKRGTYPNGYTLVLVHPSPPKTCWRLNSQYFWKWTNANPMKIFRQSASHPKLLIGSKLSLSKQEIKFPSEDSDLVLLL